MNRTIAYRARGFAIVSAIFILVVLTALGAFILNVFTNQQIGSALDVQGIRAYQAARAGVEWGLFSVMQDAGFASNTSTQTVNQLSAASGCVSTSAAAPTTTSFTPAADTMSAFKVTVQCFASPSTSGPWVYSITSTACNQPDAGGSCPNTTNPANLYVERRLTVTF